MPLSHYIIAWGNPTAINQGQITHTVHDVMSFPFTIIFCEGIIILFCKRRRTGLNINVLWGDVFCIKLMHWFFYPFYTSCMYPARYMDLYEVPHEYISFPVFSSTGNSISSRSSGSTLALRHVPHHLFYYCIDGPFVTTLSLRVNMQRTVDFRKINICIKKNCFW